MNTLAITSAVLWGLAAAGLAWYCATIARQITYVTLADGRQQQRTLPVLFRLLLPLAPNMAPILRRLPLKGAKERAARRITAAGFEGLLPEDDFLALRALLPLVVGPLWIAFVLGASRAANVAILTSSDHIICILGLLWLFLYPVLWLRQELASRHRSIQRSLPFVLDLLTLSVEAGLDFMTALQRNVDRRRVDALAEELIRVIREIQIGKTRREALRDMAGRVNLSDLSAVASALIQADELGVSIGFILRIQADQMRQRRFERAEKLANEAPVKMLFPLMVFIFPAVFLILLGPIMVRLVQQGF